MDKNEKNVVKNPRKEANYLSAITFAWLLNTFKIGFKRELEESDLYSPLDEHSSRRLGDKMSRLWKSEEKNLQTKSKKKNVNPSLFRVLVRCFGCDIMTLGLGVAFIEFIIKISQPIFLYYLLKCFKNKNQTEAYYWGGGIALGMLLDCFIIHPTAQGLMHMGMKIRVACCSLIYRKVLRISKPSTKGETSIGQMMNLLSNDVNRLDYSVFSLHYLWISPIQTVIVGYLLYEAVGLSAVGGLVTLLIFLPLHGCYGKLVSYLTLKTAYKTDERLRLINEIISGIKVIKMYAWEKPFSSLVDKARKKEVKVIRNDLMMSEICWSFESYIPRLCIFITALSYILYGNTINAETIFLVTAYYNVLRQSLYRFFALSIKDVAEAFVSIRRLQKFMVFEEIDSQSNLHQNPSLKSKPSHGLALSFENYTATWEMNSSHNTLSHINLDIEVGSMTAIIGRVGAGKSSFFHAILKEIPVVAGEMAINGKLSYASQEAWLFASSVKKNIIFNLPMNEKRYAEVVKVCQLERDFELLPYGDSTLVGERGINLSGGQCARVNLARAIYQEADIYLLDDPLSAVDARVSRGIFEDCITDFLKDKTVVLITHQFNFLKNVDKIIVLDEGTVKGYGTYAELLNSGVNLAKTICSDDESDNSEETSITTAKHDVVAKPVAVKAVEEIEEAEDRTLGSITLKTYVQYFEAAKSILLVTLVFLVSVMCQFISLGGDWFVSYWVDYEEKNPNFNVSSADPLYGRGWFIYVLGSLTLMTVLVTLAQAYLFFNMSMRISKNLHASMFNSIIHTTMSFFNANPIGRIINRFSKDMGNIDTRIPQTQMDVLQVGLYTIAVIGIVASATPYFLILACVMAVITYFIRIFYVKTSRSVKRLEGTTRSPVFNHLNASVHGLTTIRALHAQSELTQEFDNHQDLHSSAWFIFFSGSRAFGMYMEFLCLVFTTVVIFTLILLSNSTLAGSAGLIITQCLLFTGVLQWGVRQTAELENHMTSVERVLEYSKLPQEPNADENAENSKDWPKEGRLVFQNVTLTYGSKKEPALRDLNFIVKPNEMIGIVGRTGAGKSSLINAIFRLADLEGNVIIDDVPTNKIPLKVLRSKVSIIPQEPVLFEGTLRRNLDPFEEYSDNDLWQALNDVELKSSLESVMGLDQKVTEGGSNFSVGQRQLLCLARAIVRNNKILVLDEATANVDPITDELIQKTIRRKFANCTVLIIAHRLHTVMDSSRILVMDAGRAVEFDHPYKLLQIENGVFYNMVEQTGSSVAEYLEEIAKSNYEKSLGNTNVESKQ